MTINKQPGSLNATVLLLWLTAAAIAPYESEGVYYALIGGNHAMHFRQSYWKKLVRGAIKRVFRLQYCPKEKEAYILFPLDAVKAQHCKAPAPLFASPAPRPVN